LRHLAGLNPPDYKPNFTY